ncbi:hypothetical protein EYC95_29350, partial [Pseudomonas sp. BGI-2]
LDHLHDFQLEAVVECSAFVGHENLLDRCIFHLSRCPGKLDHYRALWRGDKSPRHRARSHRGICWWTIYLPLLICGGPAGGGAL